MKKTNKKGFTLVELVIVIAVIAILAAVLIPVFANLIGKAKDAAALQNARTTLEELAVEAAENNQDIPADVVIEIDEDHVYAVKGGAFLPVSEEDSTIKVYTESELADAKAAVDAEATSWDNTTHNGYTVYYPAD
ncbi:MAG: type II secretion system protein [Clostridia bacterium]|nr:type II secretion system protein [Clostridia bacterium]